MDIFILSLMNGISYGFILFLLTSGLSIIMGVMGILNMAHGALYMIGAYVGWTVASFYHLNYGLALVAGTVVGGLVGLFIERFFFRHLHKQYSEQVLLSFGLLFAITNLVQWIWGPTSKVPFSPVLFSGSFNFGIFSYPKSRIVIILIGILVAFLLWWMIEKTRTGAIVRAGMDNKEMIQGLGVNYGLISALVFIGGAMMAGFAGVLGSQVLGASTNLALDVQLFAMVVIIIGGGGSIQGSLIGGLVIGIIDSMGRTYFPQIALFIIYLAMVIILLTRPTGLLGKRTS